MITRAAKILLSASMLMLASCNAGAPADNTLAMDDITDNVQVDARALHPCRVTGTRLTDEDCNAAQYWLDQSRRGNASFKAPPKMRQGETKYVTLAIGTAPAPTPTPAATPDPALENMAAAGNATADGNETAALRPPPDRPVAGDRTPHDMVAEGGGTGRTVDYHPFVGQKMKATLEGAGFEVKPLSPEVQTVTEGSNALWRWSVTAHERGDLSLILRTTVVMIDSQGKPQELRPTVEPQPIHVSIGAATIKDWLTGFPDWLKAITAILVAAGALVAAWKALKATVLGAKARADAPAPAAKGEEPKTPEHGGE